MASAETMTRPHDRHSRRRPFSNWMKRLANLKTSSSETSTNGSDKQATNLPASKQKSKKAAIAKNSPYCSPEKPHAQTSAPPNGHLSFGVPPSGRSIDCESPSQSKSSLPVSSDSRQQPPAGKKSAAPTVSTNHDTIHSEAAQSKAGTTTTAGGAQSSRGLGGEGSTFSSPAPSIRSMTTTLTTIQSAAPSHFIGGTNHQTPTVNTPQTLQHNAPQFSHQFPTSSPVSAIPSHVVPHGSGGHPATYNTATANNLLSDNASILTLASSSKRRRRNSLDTNASVRALAPSSLFGGSRESLPLSVLSAAPGDQTTTLSALHGRPGVGGIGPTERASVYSSSGIAPALSSDRNSYYATKQNVPGDGGSTRSGLISHGRNDSTTGSIGGMASTGSPLASPREALGPGKISRRNSGWGEVNEDGDEDEENMKDKTAE